MAGERNHDNGGRRFDGRRGLHDTRARFGKDGPFLFGAFPHYSVNLGRFGDDGAASAYVDKALLLMPDDLRKDLVASKQDAITVYALNGKAVRTVTTLTGFAKGLAALDKHHASQ